MLYKMYIHYNIYIIYLNSFIYYNYNHKVTKVVILSLGLPDVTGLRGQVQRRDPIRPSLSDCRHLFFCILFGLKQRLK